jgi:hypothetical protein
MLIAETSTWEAVAVCDNVAFHVGNAEDRAALAEREKLERVSRTEIKKAAALASAHDDAEFLIQKISLLEVELEA